MYMHGEETNRLRIRKLSMEDIPEWETFFINNESLPFLGIDINIDTYSNAKRWIEKQLKRYENGLFGHHALIEKSSGAFIGQCGLLAQNLNGKDELEIGYSLLPSYWGKGYATEAAQKFKVYAIENQLAESVISIIDIRNQRSQSVARKLDMYISDQTQYNDQEVYIFRLDF